MAITLVDPLILQLKNNEPVSEDLLVQLQALSDQNGLTTQIIRTYMEKIPFVRKETTRKQWRKAKEQWIEDMNLKTLFVNRSMNLKKKYNIFPNKVVSKVNVPNLTLAERELRNAWFNASKTTRLNPSIGQRADRSLTDTLVLLTKLPATDIDQWFAMANMHGPGVRISDIYKVSPQPQPQPQPQPEIDYSKLKVAELKKLCREKNLKPSGKKSDLIRRLQGTEFKIIDGSKVEGNYDDKWYKGTVTRVNSDNTYDIKYDNGHEEQNVQRLNVRFWKKKKKKEKKLTAFQLKLQARKWTTEQQNALEKALVIYPQSLPEKERWEKITEAVPGKKKKECMTRAKYLEKELKLVKRKVNMLKKIKPDSINMFILDALLTKNITTKINVNTIFDALEDNRQLYTQFMSLSGRRTAPQLTDMTEKQVAKIYKKWRERLTTGSNKYTFKSRFFNQLFSLSPAQVQLLLDKYERKKDTSYKGFTALIKPEKLIDEIIEEPDKAVQSQDGEIDPIIDKLRGLETDDVHFEKQWGENIEKLSVLIGVDLEFVDPDILKEVLGWPIRALMDSNIPARIRLVKLYERFNPDKLEQVDDTLKRYQTHEVELFKRLKKKYVKKEMEDADILFEDYLYTKIRKYFRDHPELLMPKVDLTDTDDFDIDKHETIEEIEIDYDQRNQTRLLDEKKKLEDKLKNTKNTEEQIKIKAEIDKKDKIYHKLIERQIRRKKLYEKFPKKTPTSVFSHTGIAWDKHKKKWMARIPDIKGKFIIIKYYDTEKQAVRAYENAKRRTKHKPKSDLPDKMSKSIVVNSQINNLKLALDQHRYTEVNGKMSPSPDNKDWAEICSAYFSDRYSEYMTLKQSKKYIRHMGKIIIMLDENRSQIGKYNTIFSKRLHLGVYKPEDLPDLTLRETFPEQYMIKALDLDAIYNQAVNKYVSEQLMRLSYIQDPTKHIKTKPRISVTGNLMNKEAQNIARALERIKKHDKAAWIQINEVSDEGDMLTFGKNIIKYLRPDIWAKITRKDSDWIINTEKLERWLDVAYEKDVKKILGPNVSVHQQLTRDNITLLALILTNKLSSKKDEELEKLLKPKKHWEADIEQMLKEQAMANSYLLDIKNPFNEFEHYINELCNEQTMTGGVNDGGDLFKEHKVCQEKDCVNIVENEKGVVCKTCVDKLFDINDIISPQEQDKDKDKDQDQDQEQDQDKDQDQEQEQTSFKFNDGLNRPKCDKCDRTLMYTFNKNIIQSKICCC